MTINRLAWEHGRIEVDAADEEEGQRDRGGREEEDEEGGRERGRRGGGGREQQQQPRWSKKSSHTVLVKTIKQSWCRAIRAVSRRFIDFTGFRVRHETFISSDSLWYFTAATNEPNRATIACIIYLYFSRPSISDRDNIIVYRTQKSREPHVQRLKSLKFFCSWRKRTRRGAEGDARGTRLRLPSVDWRSGKRQWPWCRSLRS